MTRALQRLPDRADAPVHHVRRRDHVRPRRRLVERLPDQHLGGVVVEHVTVVIDQPVLPVAGIRIERDVGQDADIAAARILDRTHRTAHQVIGVERFLAAFAAQVALRVGEQRDARDAGRDRVLGALGNQIDRPAGHARQRADRVLDPRPLGHEQRPDQVGGRKRGFAVHRPAPRRGAHAAQAGHGISCAHGCVLWRKTTMRAISACVQRVPERLPPSGSSAAPGSIASNCASFARTASSSRESCAVFTCGLRIMKRAVPGLTGWPSRRSS